MGKNKAFLELDGKTIIERVVSSIPPDEHAIKIITNSFEDYESLGLKMLADQFQGVGPLAGIHAGLLDSTSQFSFFLACDLPFLSESIIRKILSEHQNQDIFGAKSAFGWEPLCAIYAKACLPNIEKQIAKANYSLNALLDFTEHGIVDLSSGNTLFNLNTNEDWSSIKDKGL